VTDSAAPLIDITDLAKEYSSGPPLRIARLSVHRHDRIALVGLDEAAAETLLHLVTGAAVPDEGTVLVAGHDTRAIATDTEWLASLDRFGLVTDRAVLLEKMPIAANLAMPLTLSIDPMSDAVLAQVTALGADVGLAPDRLRSEASSLDAEERVRVASRARDRAGTAGVAARASDRAHQESAAIGCARRDAQASLRTAVYRIRRADRRSRLCGRSGRDDVSNRSSDRRGGARRLVAATAGEDEELSQLVLFDIDGTLCLTGRAGLRGMEAAFLQLHGIENALKDVPFAGRTDYSIVGDALTHWGREASDAEIKRLRDAYVHAPARRAAEAGARSERGLAGSRGAARCAGRPRRHRRRPAHREFRRRRRAEARALRPLAAVSLRGLR
jgi:predicted ABC-type transport system involved in lysophospholipase L1 biosynthesis ATPase subunit